MAETAKKTTVVKEIDTTLLNINDVCDGIKNLKGNAAAIEAYLKKTIKVKEYVPVEVKIITCAVVLKNYIKYVDGIPQYNTPEKLVANVMTFIASYTNLNLEKGKNMAEYDMVKQSGILEYVMNTVDELELEEFNLIFESAYSDFFKNTMSTHRFVAVQVNRLGTFVEKAAGLIGEAIQKADIKKIVEDATEVAKSKIKAVK